VTGRLLAITGGHRFDADAFASMLDDACLALGWDWTHETQPDAQRWLRGEHAGAWDAILLHDLPGLALARGAEPAPTDPSPEVQRGVEELIAAGVGIVATHHALAGWPTWDGWADVLGGRFLYSPGRLHGVDVPASGYRMDTYRVTPAGGHPVTDGVEPFELTDELYLCPVFEGDVEPLLTTDADLSPATMVDTYREVRHGERVAARQQPASNLLGWVHEPGRSRVVYLLPGHTATTMQHPAYRRLLANALAWVSDEAASRSPT
jgi:type 1 glutamine amidotransferase